MILVFGKSGQVATELSLLDDVVCIGRDTLDLEDTSNCHTIIRLHNPKAVINAAAYTSVDQAEDDEELAHKINAVAPAAIAEACKSLNIPFVHISTDYVFDGSGNMPWDSESPTAPLGAYGRTKRDGELAVHAVNSEAVVLRTSWIFSTTGDNFVKKMLKLAENRTQISIVSDQIGGPTSARSVAAACYDIATTLIDSDSLSTNNRFYHFSGCPDVSWADFAEEIFLQTRNTVLVKKVSTNDYTTPARRPLNSRLDCTKLENDFYISRTNWKDELTLVLKKLIKHG